MNDAKMEDVVSVLRNMGYKKAEAQKRADAARVQLGPDADLEALIKEGLKQPAQVALPPPPAPSTARPCRNEGKPARRDRKPQQAAQRVQQPRVVVGPVQLQQIRKEELEEEEDTSIGGWKLFLGFIALSIACFCYFGVVPTFMVLVALVGILYLIGRASTRIVVSRREDQ